MTPLANEILLHVFGECHLSALIAGRGVCRKWRNLIAVAALHPTRRALLDIYLRIIEEPWFLETRPWLQEHLQSFDRKAHVEALLEQHPYLPEAFRIWVSEWPALAVIGHFWPGLSEERFEETSPTGVLMGWNHLNANPVVHTVTCLKKWGDFSSPDLIPGLPIYQVAWRQTTWLLLSDDTRFRDQVVSTSGGNYFVAASTVATWPSWIEFFKSEVAKASLLHGRFRYELGVLGRLLPAPSPSQQREKIHYTPWHRQVEPVLKI